MKKLPIVLLVVIGLAACGSSGSGSTPATSSAPKSAATVEITAKAEPGLGTVLVDSTGKTLYQFVPDGGKKVTCTGSCAAIWPPVTLPAGAKPTAAGGVNASLLGSDVNPSGGRVVTYAGWPLYTYVSDTSPGAHTGEGINQSGGLWYVMNVAGKAVK